MLLAICFQRMKPVLLALSLSTGLLVAQEASKTSFYDVQVSKDEIYKYSDLKFSGDYTSFESTAGYVALGRTEAGVTVVIVLGEGSVTIEAPAAGQEKFKTVFGSYPLKAGFKSIYMRISPKEYEETLGKEALTKTPDEEIAAKAKELFDLRFLSSFHAGSKAIIPPYKTRVMDFELADIGQIINEEGYWLILRRVTPYGSVYPSRFLNPKQRYQ